MAQKIEKLNSSDSIWSYLQPSSIIKHIDVNKSNKFNSESGASVQMDLDLDNIDPDDSSISSIHEFGLPDMGEASQERDPPINNNFIDGEVEGDNINIRENKDRESWGGHHSKESSIITLNNSESSSVESESYILNINSTLQVTTEEKIVEKSKECVKCSDIERGIDRAYKQSKSNKTVQGDAKFADWSFHTQYTRSHIQGRPPNTSKFYNCLNKIPRISLQNKKYEFIWESFILICALWVAIMGPLIATFLYTDMYLYGSEKDAETWDILYLICNTIDLIFILDLLMNFLRTYIDDGSTEHFDIKEIAIHYLHTGFWRDFILSFPYFIFEYMAESAYSYIKYLSFLKILRLYKVHAIFNKTAVKARYKLIFNFIHYLGIMFLLSHIHACIYHECLEYTQHNWSSPRDTVYGQAEYYYSAKTSTKYALCFYYTSCLIHRNGDVLVHNNALNMYTIYLQLMGKVAIAVLIGKAYDIVVKAQQKNSLLQEQLDMISDISSKYEFPRELTNKILKFIMGGENNIDLTRELNEFLGILPPGLKKEIHYEMYMQVVCSSPSFNVLSRDERIFLIKNMENQFFDSGDSIYMEGDEAHSLYIILKGTVEILFEEGIEEDVTSKNRRLSSMFGNLIQEKHQELSNLKRNGYLFGENALFLQEGKYDHSAFSATKCQIGIIGYSSIVYLMKSNPLFKNALQETTLHFYLEQINSFIHPLERLKVYMPKDDKIAFSTFLLSKRKIAKLGDVIQPRGSPVHSMYIIHTGSLHIRMSTFARNIRDTRYEEGRTQIVFQKLGVGDIIGQYGVLDQRQHLYEIYVASDSCVYYQLSESVIRKLVISNGNFSEAFARSMVSTRDYNIDPENLVHETKIQRYFRVIRESVLDRTILKFQREKQTHSDQIKLPNTKITSTILPVLKAQKLAITTNKKKKAIKNFNRNTVVKLINKLDIDQMFKNISK